MDHRFVLLLPFALAAVVLGFCFGRVPVLSPVPAPLTFARPRVVAPWLPGLFFFVVAIAVTPLRKRDVDRSGRAAGRERTFSHPGNVLPRTD